MFCKDLKRFSFIVAALLVIESSVSAQITTAENGLNTPTANTVHLGGSLLQYTTIDLSGYEFHLKNNATPVFTTLANGNVGIGTNYPGARLSFNNVDQSDEPMGITWYNNAPTAYGIHRTAGSWVAPNYQQLRMSFNTGIILDPGTDYGKSYVDIVGNGLRVTHGNIGIGTTDPHGLLSLGNSVANGKLAIWQGNYNGQIYSAGLGMQSGQFRLYIPSYDNRFSFLSAEDATDEVMTVLGTGNVGIGTANPGAKLSLGNTISNSKLAIWEGYYGGQILRSGFGITNGQFRIFIPSSDNRFSFLSDEGGSSELMTIQGEGKVGIGNITPHSKLEVGTSPDDDQSPYTSSIWDTYSTRFNNGNISIFSAGGFNTTGSSYQLSFYSRYWDGGQGAITNKSAYIKGTSTTDRNNAQDMWMGRGTLVLGSTNTNYYPTGFTDVPTVYLSNGQVGIGVSTPESQLHTNGSVRFAGLTNDNAKDRVIVSDANGNLAYRDAATLGGSGTAGWGFGGNSVATSSALGTTSNFDLPIITNNTEQMRIGANGNVGIGTTSIANYKLSVNGNIRTRKVRVDQDTWADYVFENNYQLRPINELEQYIQTEKHLPDVPSAAEVKKEGLDLGNNQAVLLKKIEELTLYVIEQNKKIEALQKLVLQQQSEKEAQQKERSKGSR